MKRFLMIIWISGLLLPTGLMAQEVYKDTDGRYILDLTVEKGMPAGAVTNVSKTSQWTGTPANSGSTLANNTITGSINATVYQKLEVAPKDIDADGVIGGTGAALMDWATAFTNCRNASYNGTTGWRLPTQRELLLIHVFRPALVGLGASGFAHTDFSYWSGTEWDKATGLRVSVQFGYSGYQHAKTRTNRVRCVREVD